MMKKYYNISVLVTLLAMLTLSTGFVSADEGEMKIKLSGVILDESGNLGVNQETFNSYEGFGFSLYDFRYQTDAGCGFTADLYNVSMNNRNMKFSAYKPGLMSISAFNNQYRRTYDTDGVNYTRRESSGISGFIKPAKNFKLFGGFNYNDKDGISQSVYRTVVDTVELATNYTQYSYNFGASGYCPYGKMMFEYKNIVFQDDLNFANDREANLFKISLFSSYPKHEELKFSGGYIYRKDFLNERTTELKIGTFWGAARYFHRRNWMFDYKLVLSQADHNSDLYETDNSRHTFSLTKLCQGGGVGAAYEMRTADNTVDRTTSDGFLLNGWYNYQNKLYIKAKYSILNKDVDDGATLIGDEERSRHNLSVKYVDPVWGSIKGKIEKRIKKYESLDSEVDYTTASATLFLKNKEAGKISFSVKYYLGEYKNQSRTNGYEFSDYVLSAYIYPLLTRWTDRIELWTGASYYTSSRDIDLEKFNFNVGVSWEFIPEHMLMAKYNAYTYDDYLVSSDTYIANIVEISLIKNIKL